MIVPRPNPTFGVLVFYAVVVTAALLLVLLRPVTIGPTRAEADRESARLAALVQATRVEAPEHGGPLHLTWSPAPGGYRGLAVRPQWHRDADDAGPEVHLAVRLAITDAALLRGPARTPLPSANLYREPWATDLVPRRDRSRLIVIVDPSAQAAPAAPAAAVAVDNVLRESGGEAASSFGRVWAGLAPTGAGRAEARSLRVLQLLARTLRGRICDDPGVWSSCRSTALTLAPSQRSNSYRINLMELGGGPGTVAFELELAGAGERPAKGTLRPLGGATLSRAADLFAMPPRGSDDVAAPGDPGLVVAGWRPGDNGWRNRRWTIDFEALLAGSEW